MGKVELQSDQEHQEHQAELAQYAKNDRGVFRKDGLDRPGSKVPEHRGPQHQPRHDLAHDLWLADFPRQPSTQLSRGDNHHELDQNVKQKVFEVFHRRQVPLLPFSESKNDSPRRQPPSAPRTRA